MKMLSPKDAIDSAISVYNLRQGDSNLEERLAPYPNLLNEFNFSTASKFNSVTGAFLFKKKSGFGYIANRKDSLSNEAIISIRGTASLFDWLTDFNVGLQTSSTGKFVHAGFNRAFNEFLPDLQRYFSQNNPSVVHCVGHSLGGALATLTADWITHHSLSKPVVYTFGSPRVGFEPFSDRLTTNIDKKHIYRVHHQNDIISMVPAWPYMHIPHQGLSCVINQDKYGPISAHYKDNYSTSLKHLVKTSAWTDLKKPVIERTDELEITKWLSFDTVKILSNYAISMIGKAISYIFKVSGIIIHGGIGIMGFTILDKLSMALDSAIKVSKEAFGLLRMLLEKIISLLGLTINVGKNITVQLIQWIFNQLSTAIHKMASMAIRLTHS